MGLGGPAPWGNYAQACKAGAPCQAHSKHLGLEGALTIPDLQGLSQLRVLGARGIPTLIFFHLRRLRDKEEKGEEGTPIPDTSRQLGPPCLRSSGRHSPR